MVCEMAAAISRSLAAHGRLLGKRSRGTVGCSGGSGLATEDQARREGTAGKQRGSLPREMGGRKLLSPEIVTPGRVAVTAATSEVSLAGGAADGRSGGCRRLGLAPEVTKKFWVAATTGQPTAAMSTSLNS
ncbi:hypothetical protein LXL04_006742 [Taraxacum kok-saghyz]